MEKITFSTDEVWNDEKEYIVFWAKKNNEEIICRIDKNALNDHFNAEQSTPLSAFRENRIKINQIAENKIQKGDYTIDGTILITTLSMAQY